MNMAAAPPVGRRQKTNLSFLENGRIWRISLAGYCRGCAPAASPLPHRRSKNSLHMLCEVEFAACLYLQKISGLGQAIAFLDRSIAANGQQRPLLLPAGSLGVAAAYIVQRLAERCVCNPVRLNQLLQSIGVFLISARRACAACGCRNRRGDDCAAGVEKQGAAVDPGRGELSHLLRSLSDRRHVTI